MSDSKRLSQERFNTFAQGYVSSQTHAKGGELDLLVEIAQPQATWHMLDIATGGGHTALKFAPHVTRVTASDLASSMLDAARQFIGGKGITNVDFREADAEDLPFEDAVFELVTCRIAPHHFPDCARFVRESARVLKPGGLLLVQDHVLPEDAEAARYVDAVEKLRDPSHHRAFNKSEWVEMFRAANLNVEQTEHIVKRHDFLPWVERQGCAPEVIAEVERMIVAAPPLAAEWLQAENMGTPQASFANHHLIIAGRRTDKPVAL